MSKIRHAIVAVALAASGTALAQSSDFGIERLRLDPSARGSLVLGGGEVLPQGGFRLALALHYEREPLVVATDGHVRGRGVGAQHDLGTSIVKDRLTLHLDGAYGIVSGLEAIAELPIIPWQQGDGTGLDKFAVAAPRVGLRLGSSGAKPFAGALSFEVQPEWSTADAFEGNAKGWSFIPGVGVSARAGGSMFIANVSALLRTQTVELTGGEKLDTELLAGLGWATTGGPLRYEITARGAVDVGARPRAGESAEVLGGVRWNAGPAEVFAVAGPGFFELPGTPTFRALVGIALDGGGAAKPAPAPAPAPVAAKPAETPPEKPAEKPVDKCAPGQKHTPEECPDADDDGDGVPNKDDRCPTEKGPKENHGCPAKDSDGDGIPDYLDKCPDTPGVPEEQGCPPKRAQINVETGKIDITEKVYFDTGKATIQERSNKLLDDVAALLNANKKVAVTVEGHTDNTGAADYNRQLSKERAEAVKAYLVKKGVAAERLEAKGLGPDKPAQSNKTAAGRDANRRVEFVIQKQ